MADEPAELPEMDLFEHLRELRRRLLWSSVSVTIAAFVAYYFSSEIFEILSAPYFQAFNQNTLIGTGPAEAFLLKVKVAIFSGFVLSAPVLFYQVWLFIAPGLYDHERRMVIPFVFSTSALFLMGGWFCYEVVFPFAFKFFHQEYESIGVTPTVRIGEHLSIVMQGILGFGLVFQMPVLAFFLARLGLIDHRSLISGFRYAVVIIFIVAAILTPPDVVTQFLMAGPLLLLYCLSIVIVYFTQSKDEEIQ